MNRRAFLASVPLAVVAAKAGASLTKTPVVGDVRVTDKAITVHAINGQPVLGTANYNGRTLYFTRNGTYEDAALKPLDVKRAPLRRRMGRRRRQRVRRRKT